MTTSATSPGRVNHLAGGLAGHLLGFDAGCLAERLRHPVIAKPEVGGYWSRADRVQANPAGPDLFGQG